MKKKLLKVLKIAFWALENPRDVFRGLESAMFSLRATTFTRDRSFHNGRSNPTIDFDSRLNPIKSYFGFLFDGQWNLEMESLF